MGIVKVDAHTRRLQALGTATLELKAVAALHRAKRRYMEHLARAQLLAVLRGIEQVGMALAKSVVHLGHDGAQAAIGAVAVPKTHGLKAVAQHAWVAMQPDFPIHTVDALAVQQRFQPGQGTALRGAAAIAVVGIAKGQRTAPVQCQHACRFGLRAQRAHGQQQKKCWHDETVAAWAQPGVPHMAKANVGLVGGQRRGRGGHAASRRCSCCSNKSAAR